MSTTDQRFLLFHSVDRSNGKLSGISFQFLPELESEARLMISNLLPYLHYHYGETTKNCFTPSAVERLTDCSWDPEARTIVGAYDEEINFLDESDLMAQYIASKDIQQPTSHFTPTTPNNDQNLNPITLHTTAYGNDDDSVSTLGNQLTKKWSPGFVPPSSPSRPQVPQTIVHSEKQAYSDDKSTSTISTLNTRINSIEGQFQQLSGTMEHIKDMLSLIATPTTAQDGDPKLSVSAGQGNLAGEAP